MGIREWEARVLTQPGAEDRVNKIHNEMRKVAMRKTYYHNDHDQITELLIGHKVTKVADDTLTLDNGHTLRFVGNDGGCACSAGCYDLTELNGVDNIITNVEFDDGPDEYKEGDSYYKIFVFADNQRINLATFEGSDGNGYYGTGYAITVTMPDTP